jgi:Amt family ammonium transporter
MVAFLAAETFGGNQGDLAIGRQFLLQLGAGLGVAVYTGGITWGILKGVEAFVPLRVEKVEEDTGLDVVLHDESGYRY